MSEWRAYITQTGRWTYRVTISTGMRNVSTAEVIGRKRAERLGRRWAHDEIVREERERQTWEVRP